MLKAASTKAESTTAESVIRPKQLARSETNRNAFQQTYLVKPPQILQPVALLMFRVEAIPMLLFTVPIQICQVKLVLCFTAWSSILASCFGLMTDSAVVDSALVDAALRKSGLISNGKE